jgi:hypothetical protein
MEFLKFWKTVETNIINSPRKSPSVVTIPRKQIDKNHEGSLEFSLKKDHHYFTVMVNEMFLSKQRHWFETIDPVVYVVSEFTYQGKRQVSPFLVGPNLLKERGIPDNIANGTIVRNTCVCGPHPYRGGGLTLSVVLCEAQTGNVLRPLLQVIESTTGALGFSPALAPYVKVANVLMEGFQQLFSSGGATPIASFRDSFGPNVGTALRPTYFALIDDPGVNPATLWVRENQLVQGGSLEKAVPYRSSDFVLYSIGCPDENTRDDVEELPFNDLWKRVQQEAASPVEDPNFKSAVQLMVTLYQGIVLSPDLTEAHADGLADQYNTRMRKIHDDAKKFGHLAAQEEGDDTKQRLDRARKMSLALLEK